MVTDNKVFINDVDTASYGVVAWGRPDIPSPEQKTEHVEIKGRDSSLTKKGGYKDIIYPIVFYHLKPNLSFKDVFRKFKIFLLNAKQLRFADDAGLYYKIKSYTISTAENQLNEYGQFTIHFTLDPFMYEVENEQITITSSTTIKNDGYDCLPIIEVTSAGSGRIFINDNEILITNINGKIVIDSEQKNAYRPGNPPLPANNRMEGDFPIILNGDNRVRFNGDISKLEITLNKRWR